MRTIKFRGLFHNGGWYYGVMCEPWENGLPNVLPLRLFFSMVEKESISKETVGQFTGLRDKNGKEIYEGDVVRASIYCDEDAQVLEVKYRGTGFVIDYRDSEADYFMLSDFPGTVEVLGNIYENPELLK